MKHKTYLATVSICLLCIITCISGCATPENTGVSSLPAVGGEALPEVTLSDMRVFSFADVDSDSPYYDTACYMFYNELISTNNTEFADSIGCLFAPYDIATRNDAAKALRLEEEENTILTRGGLANLLYTAAKAKGMSTESTLSSLPYRDATDVLPEEKEALLWAIDSGLFKSFVGFRLLPNTAVSRLQLAEAVILFNALDDDTLAKEVASKISSRTVYSAAINNHSAIQAAIDTAATRHGAVGVQVAVIEKGVVTDTFTYGFATKDTDEMTVNHKIRTASITKVAVGTGAWLLYEDGKISLDSDIGQYWDTDIKNPAYPDEPITIRTLLTHTSSIYDAPFGTSRKYEDFKVALSTSDGYTEYRPGSKWKYNNHAFTALGITLERAGGVTLNDLLTERIFRPLDMDAAFATGDIKNSDLLATIYRKGGNVGLGTDAAKAMHCDKTAGADGRHFAGGLTTSAYDLAKFFSLLANDGFYEGISLLEAETVALMESYGEHTVSGGFYQAMPLRFKKNLFGREGIYFHTGSSYGVFNTASYDPQSGDGVIVLTTGADGDKGTAGIYQICEEISQYIYGIIKQNS